MARAAAGDDATIRAADAAVLQETARVGLAVEDIDIARDESPITVPSRLGFARDLPDLVAFVMAAWLRRGEACGLTGNAVDLEVGTAEVRTAAVRVRGQSLVDTSTRTDARTLVLPR